MAFASSYLSGHLYKKHFQTPMRNGSGDEPDDPADVNRYDQSPANAVDRSSADSGSGSGSGDKGSDGTAGSGSGSGPDSGSASGGKCGSGSGSGSGSGKDDDTDCPCVEDLEKYEKYSEKAEEAREKAQEKYDKALDKYGDPDKAADKAAKYFEKAEKYQEKADKFKCNEAPKFIIPDSDHFPINIHGEKNADGSTVGTFIAADPDGDTLHFEMSGPDQQWFRLAYIGDTANLFVDTDHLPVAMGPPLDPGNAALAAHSQDGRGHYQVTVSVADPDGLTDTMLLEIYYSAGA